MAKAQIMIVEDESIVAMDLQYRLESIGYGVCAVVASAEEAVEKVAQVYPQLILMDVVLKGKMDGIDGARQIKQSHDIPIIYLTAYGDDKTLERAKVTEPYGYILKPFETRDLHTAIEMALYKHKMSVELKESEEKYRLLIKNIPNVVFKGYKDWFVDFFDDKIEIMTGYKKEDFNYRRIKWSDLIIPQDLDSARDTFLNALHTNQTYIREYRIKTKDGRILWVQEGSQIVLNKEGDIDFVIGAFLDNTKRKDEEEAIKITNECFLSFGSNPDENIKKIVETAGKMLDGFYALYNKEADGDLVAVEDWNAPEGFVYKREKQGTVCFDLMTKYKEEFLIINDLDKTNYFKTDSTISQYNLRVYAGCLVKGNNNSIIGSLCVFYQHKPDISQNELKIMSLLAKAIGIEEERKLSQQQLIRSSKMAGIGVLASGVAHEFNNLLAIMRAKAEIALLDKTEQNSSDALGSVMSSTERAQKIVQSLLNFSKRIKPVYEESDLVGAMNETLTLVERELQKQRITLVKNFQTVPRIFMDTGQIQQVFLNMLVNVKEAMPSGGNLTVDIFSSEGNIYVKIADTGPGIKPEYLNRIFEPFFTTKDSLNDGSREGTGLGLFVSQGIINNHGGEIKVDSSESGTVFTINLPIERRKKQRS